MRGLDVRLLGQGRIEFDGQAVTRLLAPKQQALVYLLAAADAPLPRTRLAPLLWGDLDDAAARSNLRGALYRMRRWLPGVLAADGADVGFAAGLPIQVDLRELSHALLPGAAAAQRRAAAAAWRGPLLDGFEVGDAEGFETWLAQTRQRALREAQSLRRELLRSAEAEDRLDEAVEHGQALLVLDDADEEAHMALMRLLAAAGRRTAALAQYESCRAALADRLGARPSAACYALYTRIHADAARPAAAGMTASAPAEASPAIQPQPARIPPLTPSVVADPSLVPCHWHASIPTMPGPLIGRDADFALAVERLAEPACHWLTVVGPGGVGKTRLALALAEAQVGRCRHGVLRFSGRDDSRGALRDADALAQQVIERAGADRQLPGALLLWLDDLEAAPQAREFASMLRERAPGVQVLATSRVRVGAAQEWLLPLDGLPTARTRPDDPASSPAAALFVAAARRLLPGFDGAAQAAAVERLAEAVGGLPLALEMAARSAIDFGLPAVLQRLESGALPDSGPATSRPTDRNGLGAASTADAPGRSLAQVFDESWALLDDAARSAALRLAWLPARFDAELARVVGAGDAAVAMLRAHSWLALRGGGTGPSLGFHPLQHQYLRSRPEAAALADEVRDAVARALAARMPAAVAPFTDLAPDDGASRAHARTLADSALGSAALWPAAAARMAATAEPQAFADWIDRAVATLGAAERPLEAAALLGSTEVRRDLPPWRRAAWALRRGELLRDGGETTAALRSYLQGLAQLGLVEGELQQAPWHGMAAAMQRVWRRAGWPPAGPSRDAFAMLLMRSLGWTGIAYVFTPDPQPLMRCNLLVDLVSRRVPGMAWARAVIWAGGASSAGFHAIARRIEMPRAPRSADPRFAVLMDEWRGVARFGLGLWDGLVDEFEALAERVARIAQGGQYIETKALVAKLLLYEGRLAEAWVRFADLSELALRRPGESWRVWGPMGQAEVGLCLGTLPEAELHRLYERAAAAMSAMENTDAAYTLRRLGLAARLAWRRGDLAAAGAAVETGIAAAARMQAPWWAQEGIAGLGDVLLALWRRERDSGGAPGPLAALWPTYERALRSHVRRFPPGVVTLQRLRGERALLDGKRSQGLARLRRAVEMGERQGLRVELARARDALAAAEPGSDAASRAAALWNELRAAPVG